MSPGSYLVNRESADGRNRGVYEIQERYGRGAPEPDKAVVPDEEKVDVSRIPDAHRRGGRVRGASFDIELGGGRRSADADVACVRAVNVVAARRPLGLCDGAGVVAGGREDGERG